jgi:hypothetical protein
MLRLMYMKRLAVLVVLSASACSSAGSGVAGSVDATGRPFTAQDLGAPAPAADFNAVFELQYKPAEYDPKAVGAALSRCVDLPGAEWGQYRLDSYPPIEFVSFKGSSKQQKAVADCLDTVPAAEVRVQ